MTREETLRDLIQLEENMALTVYFKKATLRDLIQLEEQLLEKYELIGAYGFALSEIFEYTLSATWLRRLHAESEERIRSLKKTFEEEFGKCP